MNGIYQGACFEKRVKGKWSKRGIRTKRLYYIIKGDVDKVNTGQAVIVIGKRGMHNRTMGRNAGRCIPFIG